MAILVASHRCFHGCGNLVFHDLCHTKPEKKVHVLDSGCQCQEKAMPGGGGDVVR